MKKKGNNSKNTLDGSHEAKRSAHAVLEVLSGLKGPSEAAEALSISLPRYYVLETRALEGMVKGLEPRGKGKRKNMSLESKLESAMKERDRMKVEMERMRSLVRVANRTVGLPSAKESKSGKKGGGKKGRKRRKVNRTRRVLSRLDTPVKPKEKKSDAKPGRGAETPPPDPGGVSAERVSRDSN